MEQMPVDELIGTPLLHRPEDEVLELVRRPKFNAAIRRAIEMTNAYKRKEQDGTLTEADVLDERIDAAAELAAGRDFANGHHVHYFDKAEELQGEAGRAVRESRIQFIMQPRHVTIHKLGSGPWLPRVIPEKFKEVMFCAADYVPRQAIDVSSGSLRIVTLSDAEILRLQTSGEVRMAKPHLVREFLHKYVMAQVPDVELPQKLEDEFVGLARDGGPDNAYDRRRHQALARQVLLHVIKHTTDPLYDLYKESRKEGLWRPDTHVNPHYVVERQMLGDEKLQRRANVKRIGSSLCSALLQGREGSVPGGLVAAA